MDKTTPIPTGQALFCNAFPPNFPLTFRARTYRVRAIVDAFTGAAIVNATV
jgi:hypothetical protein